EVDSGGGQRRRDRLGWPDGGPLQIVHGGNLGMRSWSGQTIDQRLVDPQDGRVRFCLGLVDFSHDSRLSDARQVTPGERATPPAKVGCGKTLTCSDADNRL